MAFTVLAGRAAPGAAGEPNAEELLSRARDAQARGLVKRAIELATQALEAKPADPRQALYLRAQLYDRTRQFTPAEADLNRLLELVPNDPALHYQRGLVRLRLADFAGSVADFDRFAELQPSKAAQLWQRGIALFYAGRFEDARRQFEIHRTVNPRDVENSAWHFASLARLQGIDAARARWMEVRGDSRVPMREIQELMTGRGSVEAVLAAVEALKGQSRYDEAKFYGELYIALYHGAEGRRELEARYAADAAKNALAFGIMGDIAQLHADWVAAQIQKQAR